MRLRTDFWIDALRRRAEREGAYVQIARRGAAEAGAILLLVNRLDGSFDLYGPAPQYIFTGESSGERIFTQLLHRTSEALSAERIASETRFDSDLWVVEIEDKAGRVFADTATI
ncbi:DUF1491 family protein [Faunimonas sp. B44]|uniref:DUF1491 family protein n=1 Tax=Faunimonas sp. B44 TaxID=3461493 RepID=UPI0040440142